MNSFFHLAISCSSLEKAEIFYREVLGCTKTRYSLNWIDFDFFGHQLSIHACEKSKENTLSEVDHTKVPIPHFGAIISEDQFETLVRKITDLALPFLSEPKTRFSGTPEEQRTFFINDPSGNTLEFKTFRNTSTWI